MAISSTSPARSPAARPTTACIGRKTVARRLVFDVSALPASFLASEIAWPVLGSLYGREVGNAVGVVTGVAKHPGEDALKAFGAAAASSGAVGLFHIAGVTPEAPDVATALGGIAPETMISVTTRHGGRCAGAAFDRGTTETASTRWRSAARICRLPNSTRWNG